MRARVPNHHPRTTFHTVSGETVRKVPEVPEMEPHETSQRHHSARSLPGMMARPTLGGLLEPLFGQFLRDCLKNGRRVFEARVSVALNSDRWHVFYSSEPLVGSRFEARFDFSDSLSTHSGE